MDIKSQHSCHTNVAKLNLNISILKVLVKIVEVWNPTQGMRQVNKVKTQFIWIVQQIPWDIKCQRSQFGGKITTCNIHIYFKQCNNASCFVAWIYLRSTIQNIEFCAIVSLHNTMINFTILYFYLMYDIHRKFDFDHSQKGIIFIWNEKVLTVHEEYLHVCTFKRIDWSRIIIVYDEKMRRSKVANYACKRICKHIAWWACFKYTFTQLLITPDENCNL